jgi:sugar lactone lactonase YvrE
LAFTIFCCLLASSQNSRATDYALGFNGSQTVNIPLQAAQNAYPLTVMCWFMEPTNSPGNGALVGKYGSGTLNGWQLASSGGQLYAWYWRNLNNNVSFVGTGAVNDGLWHHAAFVVNSAGGILYLDGIPIQTNAWTGTPGPCTTAEPIYLGIYQGDSLYTGDLDEVSVWNVALTQSQIQTYMHQPLQGTEMGLLNYYRMNEGTGTVIHDSTANAATGVFSPNPPTWIISGALLQTPPQVATLPATVNVTSVTLSGTVNPEGLDTGSWFNWGLTTGYGNVTAMNTFAAGYTVSTNIATLSTLVPGTYHFQMVATNASGTNYGLDQSFTINPAYLLGTTNLLVAGAGGKGSVILVVTPALVSWSVSANTNWLHTMAGYQSGTGSTNIIFSVDSNPGGPRTGSFTIGDQTLTITQAPSNYVVALPFASTLVTGLNFPGREALDGAGNIYMINNPKIMEWNKTNNTLTTLTQVSGGANPSDIAVDTHGNVYFCDGALNTVKEWNAATSNVTTLVSSGLNRPEGVAVDSSGNVYIADAFNNALKEWVAASGTVVTVVSVTDPFGVTVDVAGNVYIAGGNGTLLEWQPATGKLVTLATQSQGVNGAGQLAVDGSGNVFEVDFNDGVIQEWLAAYPNGNLSLASAYGKIGVAVDGSDNLFVSYYPDGTIKELQRAFVDPTPKSEPFTAGNDSLPPVFPGTVNLTGTFAPYTDQPWVTITGLTNGVVSFSFDANDTAGPRSANIYLAGKGIPVTQGYVATSTPGLLEGPAAGADSVILQFNPPQAAPWTATANDPWLHVPAGNLYAGGNTNFAFTFDANPGPTRTGTLMLGTTPLSITQAGVTYVAAPATLTALVTNGVSGPANVAVDNSGYVYITDPGNQALDEWILVSNSLFPIVSGGLGQPAGVAFDGYGNVLFSDTTSNIIYLWYQGAGNQLIPWVTSGLNGPSGIAFDINDDFYVADSGNNAVEEFNLYSFSPVAQVSGLNHPQGVAVDVFGDVYIADTGNNAIKEWFVANSNVVTVVSNGLNHPASVAVDVSGNIFIADTGDNAIKEWVAASGTLITLVGGLNQPKGIALDSADDLYIADTGNNVVEELLRAFVDPTAVTEPFSAGSDTLPGILPNTVNLLPPFAPTSDQSWLTVADTSSGIVNFGFTANTLTLSPRTAHLSVLGLSVSVTQTNAPVVAAQLTGAHLLANGAFQFTFTNTPGFTFTVLSTTNVTLPLTDWVNMGTVTDASTGIYQFTTQPVTNSPQEFYKVVWP